MSALLSRQVRTSALGSGLGLRNTASLNLETLNMFDLIIALTTLATVYASTLMGAL